MDDDGEGREAVARRVCDVTQPDTAFHIGTPSEFDPQERGSDGQAIQSFLFRWVFLSKSAVAYMSMTAVMKDHKPCMAAHRLDMRCLISLTASWKVTVGSRIDTGRTSCR